MEGDICKLKEIVQVVKKYGVYIYVDEAHSIGALGSSGKGVCDFAGVDPKDIDILMGTFTKSFSDFHRRLRVAKLLARAQPEGSMTQKRMHGMNDPNNSALATYVLPRLLARS